MRIDVSQIGGPLVQLLDELRGENGAERLEDLKHWQKKVAVLRFERNVPISARQFIFSESFTLSNKKVKFGYIDDPKLEKLFGKIREDVPAGEIAIRTLLQDKHDPDIMAALQPHTVRFIKMGQFYQLIEAQGQGQEGPLLVNGRANIGYVLDENGAPWAVRADWYSDFGDWYVYVDSVAYQYRWNAGNQVLSQAV